MHHFSPSWRARFLDMARLAGSWSKDPSTKVGAVIVRPDRTIVSLGYNGFPRGTEDYHHALNNRAEKLRRTVHAEVNAIVTAHEKLDDCTLFVTPLHPCSTCAGIIIQSGVKHVVAEFAKDPNPSWVEDFKVAARMFKEADVKVELVTAEGN